MHYYTYESPDLITARQMVKEWTGGFAWCIPQIVLTDAWSYGYTDVFLLPGEIVTVSRHL